jgi:hypothetical protein
VETAQRTIVDSQRTVREALRAVRCELRMFRSSNRTVRLPCGTVRNAWRTVRLDAIPAAHRPLRTKADSSFPLLGIIHARKPPEGHQGGDPFEDGR